MNEHQQRIQKQLDNLNAWLLKQTVTSSTLVQYSGPEFTGNIDLERNQIEDQVKGCLSEGFRVEWESIGSKIYICVIESWDEPLDWKKVSRNESFVDIERILREAGFDD